MVTTMVLVTCEVHQTSETIQALADLDEVSKVYSLAGDWDQVTIVRAGDHDDLAATLTEPIPKVPRWPRPGRRSPSAATLLFPPGPGHMFSVGFDARRRPARLSPPLRHRGAGQHGPSDPRSVQPLTITPVGAPAGCPGGVRARSAGAAAEARP